MNLLIIVAKQKKTEFKVNNFVNASVLPNQRTRRQDNGHHSHQSMFLRCAHIYTLSVLLLVVIIFY